MKLLENSSFEVLNSALFMESGDARIVGRIESYSCKMIATEKQFYKKFAGEDGGSPNTLMALSPPQNGYGCYSYSVSPSAGSSYSRSFSRSSGSEDETFLCDAVDRKTLFHLISTLNAAFPDYDFSDTLSSEFTKEPNLQFVTSNIDNLLSISAPTQYGKIHDKLWMTLNEEIELMDCELFSYNPDLSSDPFGEDGSIWNFNYFFFNRKMKRMVFFTCRAMSPFSQEYYSNYHQDEME